MQNKKFNINDYEISYNKNMYGEKIIEITKKETTFYFPISDKILCLIKQLIKAKKI